MKHQSKIKINWIKKGVRTAAVFAAGVCVPFLWGYQTTDAQHELPQSEVPSMVAPPNVPKQVTFAGEIIDLTRYDHHERMDRELMSFTYMHSTSMLSLKRANRFFPVIEPILRREGVPDDFKYLALIESSLNPRAKSPAGAAGMWQFMKLTGRQYGLEVNDNIDERYHVEKETVAACKYLKAAYQRYGDWLSVAASYNAGQARITSALNKQHAEKATDLWLTEETSRYMFRLLAAKTIFSQPKRYGFLLKREQLYPALPYKEVTVTTGIANLADFARKRGISLAELKDANPWLRQYSLQNNSHRTYVLKIPLKKGLYYNPKTVRPHVTDWVID